MGRLIDAADVQEFCSDHPELRDVSPDRIETVFIRPIEALMARRYGWIYENEDSTFPWHLESILANDSDLNARFRTEYRSAVILLIEQRASNPGWVRSETVGGATAQYNRAWPSAVDALMDPWRGHRPPGRTAVVRR